MIASYIRSMSGEAFSGGVLIVKSCNLEDVLHFIQKDPLYDPQYRSFRIFSQRTPGGKGVTLWLKNRIRSPQALDTPHKFAHMLGKTLGDQMGFFLRWICAFLLLAMTFNPSDYNFVRWSMMNYAQELPVTVLMALLLTIGYIIYLRATLRSIGGFGMFLILAVVAALLWVLYDWGILTLENRALNTWLGIFALSCVLGIGLSWSLVRRQLSGQADMDDVDE
ncbi:MAG: DUF6524 family protein [Cognatishimia sp.]